MTQEEGFRRYLISEPSVKKAQHEGQRPRWGFPLALSHPVGPGEGVHAFYIAKVASR